MSEIFSIDPPEEDLICECTACETCDGGGYVPIMEAMRYDARGEIAEMRHTGEWRKCPKCKGSGKLGDCLVPGHGGDCLEDTNYFVSSPPDASESGPDEASPTEGQGRKS